MRGKFFFVFHGLGTFRRYYTVMGKQSTDNTLTVAQVAGRLRKSDRWVRERLHTGEIPSVWLGGRMTIFEADLDKLIERKDRSTFSHLITFHGRAVCVARKPRCPDCVLRSLCDFGHKTV